MHGPVETWIVGELTALTMMLPGVGWSPNSLGTMQLFFFSSRRRHTRYYSDWSQTCALPISQQPTAGVLRSDPEIAKMVGRMSTADADSFTSRITSDVLGRFARNGVMDGRA